ncbi:MAG: cytochrome c peroxidase [Polyangiales bacterium]
MRAARLSLSLVLGCSSGASVAVDAGRDVAPTTDAPDAPALDLLVLDAPTDAPRDVPRDAPPTNPRCPDGRALPYPDGTTLADDAPLPALRFGDLALADRYTPCAAAPDLLVLRVMAAWSGHSRWHAAHTNALRRSALGARVKVLDLLVYNEQNLPATTADLAAWRARYDAPPDALALDPGYTLRPLYLAAPRPPMVIYLDPRTMIPLQVQENPTQEEVTAALARAAARYAGAAPPTLTSPARVDGLFSPDEWEFLRTMTPPGAPPPDPTNRVADDPRAAALGEALFRDGALASNGTLSCAACHRDEHDTADGRAVGLGLRELDRNVPSVRLSAHFRWQFWDGRADSLWAQALGPLENPDEMNGARTDIARRAATAHREGYTAVFGAPPPFDDLARFPRGARPGAAAWEAMRDEDRALVDRAFVNVGKALAAYERTLRVPRTAFDRYLAGDFTAMSASARLGLRTYLDAGCAQCHFGPTLSNDSFHNIGMPTGRRDGVPDQGRYATVRALLASPFRADGPFSDDPSQGAHLAGLARVDIMEGMFRTTTLRNVARTGPWGHGGTFTTLEQVVVHYAEVATGHHREQSAAGELDPHLVGFHRDGVSATRIADLMRAMSE